ncbi:MAG: von Willebrand factor type A domain-containing protein, partial [Candidatus Promineifilaceae bacterium]
MNKRKLMIIFIVAAYILAACQAAEEVVEVTVEAPATQPPMNPVYEEPTEEAMAEEAVEVTRIVTEGIVVTAEAAPDGQIASQPLPTVVPNFSTPVPQPTMPPDNFFEVYGVNPFVSTAVDHLSTFSLDVDTGSYTIARRYVQDGLLPPSGAVRVEEFVNYFDQEYSMPSNTAFAVFADGAPSPFHHDGTYIIRIGVQGYDVPVSERPSASLTFVIDVSGSMAQENRL